MLQPTRTTVLFLTALMMALILGSCQSAVSDDDKEPEIAATSLKFGPNPDEIAGVGNTAELFAYLEPSDVTNRKVVWTSSNPAVASVASGTQTGTLTAVSPGTVTITATLGKLSASTSVSVTAGGIVSLVASIGTSNPLGLVIDSNGNIFYSANDDLIHKITPTGTVSVFVGSTSGYSDGTGTAARFHSPRGLAIDSLDNIYVADQQNQRIRKVTSGGVVTTLAGSGTEASTDGTGIAAAFFNPKALLLAPNGDLYVTGFDNRIRKIDTAAVVTTLTGSATAGFSNGPVATATFNGPTGLAMDSSNNLYVADTGNHVIRKVTPAGNVTTFAGSGTEGYASGVGTAAVLDSPQYLAIDSSDNLYITEDNFLVRKIDTSGRVTLVAGKYRWFGFTDGLGSEARFGRIWAMAMKGSSDLVILDYLISSEANGGVIRKIHLLP